MQEEPEMSVDEVDEFDEDSIVEPPPEDDDDIIIYDPETVHDFDEPIPTRPVGRSS